ncbi:MAG TPA: 3-hydroxyacyl-CoA dehydrogenase family protein [Thermoanaerobaculaceae bacterium]|nr:3-hydroxyacyl-CoA dehydrogenase family protein [Thermoanaerobaculaceae bacterium]HPS78710.1 3-hydroxyacyl-CoA dehydrogenase family protein [Thermoanaerobaculaceae bacterium]
MELKDRLRNVAVVGAAGKMGSGISLLLAEQLAFAALEDRAGTYVLSLIDISDQGLQGLVRYIREQIGKTAERQINRLRSLYAERADLVENGEMIAEFVHEALLHVRTGKSLDVAKDALLVFEAAFEKDELKIDLFKKLADGCGSATFFLTNTSAIPIGFLGRESGLEGRIVGYHFYNPPAVQKLVELIAPSQCSPGLEAMAGELARLLGKTIIPANDIAGFIGNGHFMRDGLHGLAEADRLADDLGWAESVWAVDRVSRDWLLRPMGIFQLIDYVGVDVFQLILSVMRRHIPAPELHSDLVDLYLELGVKGGQTSSGAQKDGFFRYEKGRPVAVFDPNRREYVPCEPDGWCKAVEARLGPHPDPAMSWKALQRDRDKDAKMRTYFAHLKETDTLGAELARRYAAASRAAAERLVEMGVARRPEDVNSVLTLGFFHLYGPINDLM